jgi:hypothetical protein
MENAIFTEPVVPCSIDIFVGDLEVNSSRFCLHHQHRDIRQPISNKLHNDFWRENSSKEG